MSTQTYRVHGMTCGGCVRHVEKALRGAPGVETAAVDLAAGIATVTGTAAFEGLAARVAHAGYRLERTA
ncbi:heavy-metal-associated domain-containing protein [Geothrix sp. 21YS21S-4]|uniref:heavy-metal-associated domain-containing protein n=1 Tax=Geothrix sp. 21YS21S-4 TaxID=3068889 RepID=UPI0027BA221D|nr:heavy metal-associated domain-containing protein [Geothrix sp. 21YS21S-4]